MLPIKFIYDGVKLDEGFRLDVLVENLVICELKAVDEMSPVCTAQVLTYMKLTGRRLGFLINFNVPVIKNGINRMIL
ncbi:MAG TPA: GxxExxY protein [Candidatus Hydrogenedentes bacterium]|nr:GxxExxY protein [Candidatus Hydrogenedentota bacterium]